MNRLTILLGCLLYSFTLISQECKPFSVPYPDMGINFAGPHHLPWVNLYHQANPWHSQYNNGCEIGPDGWPTAGRDHRFVIAGDVSIVITIPAGSIIKVGFKGTYDQFFETDGACEIVAGSQQNNYPKPGYAYLEVLVTQDIVPNDQTGKTSIYAFNFHGHVEDVKFIRPGFDLDDNNIIHPDYTNLLTRYSTFRFMGYLASNTHGVDNQYSCVGPSSIDWDYRWNKNAPQSFGGNKGASWEYAIELCNQFDKNMWINIPLIASDQYITELAKLIKDNLKPKLNVYIEIGNETWNTGGGFCCFRQIASHFCGNDWDCHRTLPAQLLKNTVDIFGAVWGTDQINNRIRGVLCGQVGYAADGDGWTIKSGLNWMVANGFDPGDYFYGVGAAPYFSSHGEFSSVDAIINACQNDIDNYIYGEFSREYHSQSNQYMGNKLEGWFGEAGQYGLKLVAYEGAPDMDYTTPAPGNIKDQAMRDPRMVNLCLDYWNTWYSRYGYDALFNFFLAGIGTSGLYTLTESFYTTSTRQIAHNEILTNPAPAFDESIRHIIPGNVDARKVAAYWSGWDRQDALLYLRPPDQNGWGGSDKWIIAASKNGNYNFAIEHKCNNNSTIDIYMDGKPVATNVTLPSSGGTYQWTDAQGVTNLNFELDYGIHVMRILYKENTNDNFKNFKFTLTSETPPFPPETIYGDIEACLGNPKAMYTVDINQSVCEYEWEVTGGTILPPSGGSGAAVSGQGTNRIYVDWSGAQEGEYALRVRASNGVGTSDWKTIPITLAPCGFIANPNPVCIGTNVTFTPAISGTITQWDWNFGADASPSSSNVENPPTITYSSNGNKSVKLIVTLDDGSTKTFTNEMIVGNTVGGTAVANPTSLDAGEESNINLTGATGSVVNWEYSTDNTTWVPLSTVQLPLPTGPMATSTYYRAVVKSDGCSEERSASALVTVNNPVNPGELTPSNSSVISGSTGPELTLTGYNGTILRWESKPAIGNWTSISGATGSAYTPAIITETTSYRVIVDIGGTEYPSTIATITTSISINAGTANANASEVCMGSTVNLTLSGSLGNIQWQSSTDGITFVDISNANLNAYTTSTIVSNTWYRAKVDDGAGLSDFSNIIAITVLPAITPGNISGASNFCESNTPPELSLKNSNGENFQWQESTDGSTYTNISGETDSSSFSPLGYTGTKWFRVLVSKSGCTDTPSPALPMLAQPSPSGGLITAPGSVYYGQSAGVITLAGNDGDVLRWQYLEEPYTGTWTDISETSQTYTTPPLTANTSFRAVSDGESCGEIYSDTVIITVQAITEAGFVDGTEIICESNEALLLTQTGHSGTIVKWQYATAPFNTWNDIANTTDTYSPGKLNESTHFRTQIQYTDNSTAFSQPAEITLIELSEAGELEAIQNNICENQSTEINYSGGNGEIVQWLSSNDGTNWTAINYNSPSYTTQMLNSDSYYKVSIKNGICTAIESDSILIEVLPAPATDMELSDTTICGTSKISSLISYTEENVEYTFYNSSDKKIESIIGNGNAIEVDLGTLSESSTITVKADNKNCELNLEDVAEIIVIQQSNIQINGETELCPFAGNAIYSIIPEENHTYLWLVEGGEIISNTITELEINWIDKTGEITLTDSITGISCSSNQSLSIKVEDKEIPVIQCPETTELEADYIDGEFVYEVIGEELTPNQINDNCHIISKIDNDFNNDSTLKGETLTQGDIINWFAYDPSGNKGTCQTLVDLIISFELDPPTGFSPNGDGINDTWAIEKIDLYPDANIIIFDRLGEKVFESKQGYNEPWDGKFKDAVLPVDSYHYVIKSKNKVLQKGVVTIIK